MKEITLEMIEGAYPIAKKVYSGSLTTTEGKIKIAEETGMAENSAMFYIDIFLKMLAGEVYKVSFNQMGIEYLLENIKKDYGNDSYQKALGAVKMNKEYKKDNKKSSENKPRNQGESKAITNGEYKSEEKSEPQMELNTILFGPPGTGKTRNTLRYALEKLGDTYKDKELEDEKVYKNAKKKFDDFVGKGRIQFVTFHQSYS